MSGKAKRIGFTPGKWQWHWRKDDKDAPASVFSMVREGQAVAVAMMPRYEKPKQWEVNARLIAAAPDLYDACRDALREFVAIGQVDGVEFPVEEKLRRALRRADGAES